MKITGNKDRNQKRKPVTKEHDLDETNANRSFQKALAESEGKFRSLFESMEQGVFYQTVDGNLTDVNQAALNMFGLTREEFIGRTSYNVEWKVIDEKGTLLTQGEYPSMIALLTGKPVKDMTVGIFNPVRNQFTWVITNAIPEYKNKEDKPCKVFVTMQDITDKKNAEDALAKRESELRIIHENIADIVWKLDKDTLITYISPSVKKLLGYEVEYLIGKPILEFITKEYHQSAKQNIQSRLVSGKNENPVHFQYEMIAIDGSKIPIEVSSSPIWNKDGGLLGFTGVTRNITERKKAEDGLRKSEEKFRLLTETSLIGIYIILDTKIVYVNPSFANILGYLPEEIVGKLSPQDIIHPDDIQTALKKLQERLDGIVENETTVFKAIKKDGTLIFTEVYGMSIDFQGRLALMGSMTDVTERIKAEERLRTSEEEYRTLFENSLMGISQAYTDGKFIRINKAYADLFGYPDASTMLKEISSNYKLLYSNPDDRKKVLDIIDKNGCIPPTEFELNRRNGEKFWALISAKQVKDDAGKFLFLQTEHIDITEQKHMEEELRKSKELLEKLNQHLVEVRENERNQIALNLHDDLGQKLTAINLDIAWLKSRIGVQSKSVREKFEEMSSMIKETVESIKETSSLLRPAILFDLGLVPAIKSQLGKFEKQTGIKCHFYFRPQDFLLEDRLALILYRILQESLTNIARHSGASKADVNLYVLKNKIEMIIKDDGTGIGKNKVNSFKSLGIAGIKERVKSVDGKITITGVHGSGTLIKVEIPLLKMKTND